MVLISLKMSILSPSMSRWVLCESKGASGQAASLKVFVPSELRRLSQQDDDLPVPDYPSSAGAPHSIYSIS